MTGCCGDRGRGCEGGGYWGVGVKCATFRGAFNLVRGLAIIVWGLVTLFREQFFGMTFINSVVIIIGGGLVRNSIVFFKRIIITVVLKFWGGLQFFGALVGENYDTVVQLIFGGRIGIGVEY